MQNTISGKTYSHSADFIIRISNYSAQVLQGSIEHCSSGGTVDFRGLANLLEAIDGRMNESGFPQASMNLRTWDLHEDGGLFEDNRLEPVFIPGAEPGHQLASFILRVQFRQNASWQGSLSWVEGRRAIAFRSVLEMVRLMEQAVQWASDKTSSAIVRRPKFRWTEQESVS